MDYLLITNTVAAGVTFAIWAKKDILNFLIKMLFFGLMVANILKLAGKI